MCFSNNKLSSNNKKVSNNNMVIQVFYLGCFQDFSFFKHVDRWRLVCADTQIGPDKWDQNQALLMDITCSDCYGGKGIIIVSSSVW